MAKEGFLDAYRCTIASYQGFKAYGERKAMSADPYTADTPESYAWRQGWMAACNGQPEDDEIDD